MKQKDEFFFAKNVILSTLRDMRISESDADKIRVLDSKISEIESKQFKEP